MPAFFLEHILEVKQDLCHNHPDGQQQGNSCIDVAPIETSKRCEDTKACWAQKYHSGHSTTSYKCPSGKNVPFEEPRCLPSKVLSEVRKRSYPSYLVPLMCRSNGTMIDDNEAKEVVGDEL